MAEEATTEPVVSEPQPLPEATADTATAQPVEPLNPEPAQAPETVTAPGTPVLEPEVYTPEPQLIPEPIPAPQTQTSTPPIIQTSLARELLIKAREMIQFRKRKKLEEIMGMFLKQASITNDDVQKLLYVSDATATRYLQQLEREGKIRRQGVPGHASYLRI